jgi:hypothetical protein
VGGQEEKMKRRGENTGGGKENTDRRGKGLGSD